MPTLSVALDRDRRRDMRLNSGDQDTINITVYAKDGDQTPLVVTDLRLDSRPYVGSYSLPVGSPFTVPDAYGGRRGYRITGLVGGARTTLAYGYLDVLDAPWGARGPWPIGNDYGWGWGGGYGWGWPL